MKKKNSRISRRKWKKSSFCLAIHRLLVKNDGKKEERLAVRTEEEILCSPFIFKFPRRELKG